MEFGIWASLFASMYAKHHMTTIIFLYIAVLVFSFLRFTFCMEQTPQKSVHFTITFDCLFSESSIFACEILC